MSEPLYWQIAQELRERIESGALGPGEQMPTELALQEKYGASRNTIRDAIKWLVGRGLVRSRSGRGTFVAERVTPFVTTLSVDPQTGISGGDSQTAFAEVRARGQSPTASVARVELISAAGDIAARLRVALGTQVVSRHQQRYIDGRPWSLQTTFYPMDLVMRGARRLIMAEDIAEGAVLYLGQSIGLVQVGYRDRIVVRAPEEEESRFFGLPDDGRVPVVSVVRTGFATREEAEAPAPFRVTFTIMPADRNQLVVNSGAVPERLATPAESGVPRRLPRTRTMDFYEAQRVPMPVQRRAVRDARHGAMLVRVPCRSSRRIPIATRATSPNIATIPVMAMIAATTTKPATTASTRAHPAASPQVPYPTRWSGRTGRSEPSDCTHADGLLDSTQCTKPSEPSQPLGPL